MLHDIWPPFGLLVTTRRLSLRLPSEPELVRLADLAGAGIHPPTDRPFLTPWTDGTADERARFVLRGHWGRLAGWAEDDWQLGLGVFDRSDRPLGVVTLRARDFRVAREVMTASWLGLAHHGRGYGTEARLGLLTLAFDHLGAQHAITEVFQDNHASQGVSRRLGYEPDGISRDVRGTEVLVSDRLRLSRARWKSQEHESVLVEGVDACRPLFGA